MSFNNAVSRIDKNFMNPQGIHDLEQEFGDQTPLVLEFIDFFGRKFKNNIFNLFNTTVDEFSKETGIDKSTLNRAVPIPHGKKGYPTYNDHEFKSYFDYTIYLMFSRNWVFSKPAYLTNNNTLETQIKSVQIIEEVKVRRKSDAKFAAKHYEFRLNDIFFQAMSRQYWPINSEQKKSLGQFRKSKYVRTLFLCLSGFKHTALSTKKYYVIVPLDTLAKGALIKEGQLPKHVKQTIKRMLDQITAIPNYGMTYEFFNANKYKEDYHIKLNFTGNTLEHEQEVLFHHHLIANLESYFNGRHKDTSIAGEKNHYQRWLNNDKVDLEAKAACVQQAYHAAYKRVLTLSQCSNIVMNGFYVLSENPEDNIINQAVK